MQKTPDSIEFVGYLLATIGGLFALLGAVFGFTVKRVLNGYDQAHERNDKEHKEMNNAIQQNSIDISKIQGGIEYERSSSQSQL